MATSLQRSEKGLVDNQGPNTYRTVKIWLKSVQ